MSGYISCWSWNTPKDAVASYRANLLSRGINIIDSSSSGNEHYILIEDLDTKVKVIVLLLTSKKNGYIYYKDMDENSFPYYYNCPKRILDASTSTSERSVKWREACNKKRNSKRALLEANIEYGTVLVRTNDFNPEVVFLNWHNKSRTQFVGTYPNKSKLWRFSTHQFVDSILGIPKNVDTNTPSV